MSKLVVFGSTSRVGINYIKYHQMTEKSTVIGFSRREADKHERHSDKSSKVKEFYEERYIDLRDIDSIEETANKLINEDISSILLIAGGYPLHTEDMKKEVENYMELVMTHSIFYTKLIDMIFSSKKNISCLYISSTSIYWKGSNSGYSAAKAHAEQSLLSIAQKHISSTNRINIARLTLMEEPFAQCQEQYSKKEYESRASLIPGGYAVKYDEINPTINFLLSRESSCINGNILRLDKGESLRSA